jgi:hypothetical protein
VIAALFCQVLLLTYHQVTTYFDLYPFNGARNYTVAERRAEMMSNAVLMGLAPIGFAFRFHPLMIYGAFYYFALFAIEVVIWWVPYLCVPRGPLRRAYNLVLALGTSNFQRGDTLDHWLSIHGRVHTGTLTVLPRKEGRVVPNLEHTLLHAWTLVTAVATFRVVYA